MATSNIAIKITALPNIGNNIAPTTLIPVVNMSGVPTTQKANLQITGNLILAGAGTANFVPAGLANLAYSVVNAAQPNITSTGTLNVNTLKVSGGVNGQYLQTDGTGNLAWVSGSSSGNGEVGGSNTQIQFNDAGNFGGNTGFTFVKTTGILAAPFADVSGVANIVGGGATVATKSVLNVASTFGSNSSAEPASAQAIRGRVTGANLTKTRNYVTGVTGQYLVTGTNASEFIKAGILGVVGDQTTTADGAVVAYLDGDGGLTTANAAYAVSMKNSTPNSGFNYGLDLQFINLNLGGVTTSTFKQADIRFNNGVTLVANTANNISINANVTAGNVLTSANVIANGAIESGTGLTTGGYLSVDGNTDLHNTVVTGNLSATGNITATNLGNIASINLTGSNSNVLYGNGVFAAVAGGGANTGNVTFSDINIIGTGNLKLQPDSANASAYLDIFLTAGPDIHIAGNGETVILGTDNFANVAVNVDGNVSIQAGDANGTHTWTLDTTGNLTLPGNLIIAGNTSVFGTDAALITPAPDLPLIALSAGANGSVSSLWIEDPFNVGTSNIAAVYANPTVGSGIVRIAVGQNGGPGPNLWDFNANGTTTFPGDLIGNGASPAPSISGFNSANFAGNITGGNISTAGNVSGNTNGFTIGYLNIPQVTASNATLALGDAGKHYYSTTVGNLTLTIPTNANVSFATGTAISIVVQAAGNILVNAASGVTLYMAGNSTAANRIVGGYGMSTLMKVGTDTWFIDGTGVS